MEARFRGPEHPMGASMEVDYALVRNNEGESFSTCGKVPLGSPPEFEHWPEDIRERFLGLVSALESHFMEAGDVFEPEEEVLLVSIPDGHRIEPEEF